MAAPTYAQLRNSFGAVASLNSETITERYLSCLAIIASGQYPDGTPYVPGSAVTSGPVTDRSGTITSGGTAQNAMAANASRKYLFISNPLTATEKLWFDITGSAAVASSPSIGLNPGDTFTMESNFVTNAAVSVIAATTGHAWTAKEG